MEILGGRKPAAKPAGSANAHVIDGSDRTFMADVMETSKTTPVIVDFWAPWCGPCRTLGPIIERVVTAANGAVKLVKIDIDKNPAIAGQLGVQSIPAVIAFKNGRPVDGFMGAIPEGKVKEFVARVSGGAAAGGDPDMPTVPELLAAAEESLEVGDLAAAAEAYALVLDGEPDNIEAISGLAKCYLDGGDAERAAQMMELVPPANRNHPSASAMFAALDLSKNAAEPEETKALTQKVAASPDDHDARFELGKALAAQGRLEQAADHFLAILEKDLAWNEGAAREQLLKVFEVAGAKADVTKNGRRRLSALLFR